MLFQSPTGVGDAHLRRRKSFYRDFSALDDALDDILSGEDREERGVEAVEAIVEASEALRAAPQRRGPVLYALAKVQARLEPAAVAVAARKATAVVIGEEDRADEMCRLYAYLAKIKRGPNQSSGKTSYHVIQLDGGNDVSA